MYTCLSLTHTHISYSSLFYALSPSQPLPSPNSAGGSWFSGWRVSTSCHYCWLLLCVLVLQKTERSVYHCILLSTTLNYYHYHCQHVYCMCNEAWCIRRAMIDTFRFFLFIQWWDIVTVQGKNQTLFPCIFRPHYHVWSTVVQRFH